MEELVRGEVKRFYKQEKDTHLINEMIDRYQTLVYYIELLKQVSIDDGPFDYSMILKSIIEKGTVNLTSILKAIKFTEIKENCRPQPERSKTVQCIINRASFNKVLGNEACFEEFIFVNNGRIEADYYNLSRYLLEEISIGKVDLKNHKKAIQICQTKKEYLDFCQRYISGYYEYLTNSHNTKANISKTKIYCEIDKKALKAGFALLTGVLHDNDVSSKLDTFRNNYYISDSSIDGYVYMEKTLMEKIFRNGYASDTKWRLAASEAYNLVIGTINDKNPDLIHQDNVFQKVANFQTK